MSTGLDLRRIADDVFEIPMASASEAQALANHLRTVLPAEDIVAGLTTVAIRFDPDAEASIVSSMKEVTSYKSAASEQLPTISVAIKYGGPFGPDFDWVCDHLNVSPEDFIAQHSAIEHTVEMIGFTPGFSYISGIPEAWSIPRLTTPRNRVEAGSVGISAGYTGIYALAGPGGWPLIGRTEAKLFDPDAADPFLLSPGQRVKFEPV